MNGIGYQFACAAALRAEDHIWTVDCEFLEAWRLRKRLQWYSMVGGPLDGMHEIDGRMEFVFEKIDRQPLPPPLAQIDPSTAVSTFKRHLYRRTKQFVYHYVGQI